MATGFEPTPGHEDLAAQTEAAEESEMAEALAEVRRRRAAKTEGVTSSVTAGEGLAVIDPDGEQYEVGDDGKILLDDDGEPVPKWPHQTITIRGHDIQYRTAKTTAFQALGLATSKGVSAEAQNAALASIVRKHISPRSFAELQEAMIDPDDDFTLDDFQALMKAIATQGTGRPTGPSRR